MLSRLELFDSGSCGVFRVKFRFLIEGLEVNLEALEEESWEES